MDTSERRWLIGGAIAIGLMVWIVHRSSVAVETAAGPDGLAGLSKKLLDYLHVQDATKWVSEHETVHRVSLGIMTGGLSEVAGWF